MVCNNSALLFTLLTMLCMTKVVKVACLVNKIKPMYWLQVMNAMTSKVKWQWWTYGTNEPDNVRHPCNDDDQLHVIICFVL